MIHSLKFDHFFIFLFLFEAIIHIYIKGRINMMKFKRENDMNVFKQKDGSKCRYAGVAPEVIGITQARMHTSDSPWL